jgi:hypothetical protein
MSWFKRKKKFEFDADRFAAEVMYRVRGLFLDSQLQDAFSLSVIAGTTAVSDEVAEMEQQDSDKRVQKIEHLIPLILTQTYSISKAMAELEKAKAIGKDVEVPDEFWELYQSRNQDMTLAAVVGCIAQMVDIGLLTVGPRRPNVKR